MRRIKLIKSRFEELKRQRIDWDDKWKTFTQYLAVFNGVFDDPKDTRNKWRDIYAKKNINGNPQRYFRNLSTCLTATLCPPDSKWFSFRVKNQTNAEQSWLKACSEAVLERFQGANAAEFFTHMFFEAAVFGQGVISLTPSKNKVFDFKAFTTGSIFYSI